ncbi:ATPase family associated with various cellular activities (AAA) [Microbacterium azadirachtae]|uniref:ATPase family associated with various cellular activities (AAA) n=1 Tax=Microbacterium azadirachtae TaxID=582680 RepID=A0A1I6HVL0_9MICO|nr:ATPase family associated with various cellular activities (AAA) [Microbacterium azadirachtae]
MTRLSDVAGMSDVKRRIEATFLVPARNPELREMYAASLRGGLLLYGPPGCGKTFLARALAGELGANFFSASITDILDPYVGASERNLHDLFVAARASSPAVIFFDEIDTLGQRRSSLRNAAAMRNVVNQLLIELDGVDGSNEGIYVLAASNQPWDIDPALRRPGRFDRTVFVGPPDAAAREAIFVAHLRKRPIGELDVKALARATEGLSGADIAFVCSAAAEAALMDSVGTGRARPITMDDLRDAIKETPASIGPWLDTARNIVTFSDDGTYADVKALLRRMRRS